MEMDKCHIINIDDQLVAFCKKDLFKSYVKKAINDELFWRDFLNKYDLNEKIDIRLNEKLNDKLPSRVKSQVEKIVPDLIEKEILKYINNQFLTQITREINLQIPAYLNNHQKMNEILLLHSNKLNSQLENSARNIMEKVVNDPSYNELINIHLQNTNNKCDEIIDNITKNTDQRLKKQINNFALDLDQIKEKINIDLFKLKTSLENVNILNKKINNLENANQELKKEISGLKWTNTIINLVTIISSIIGVIIITKQ